MPPHSHFHKVNSVYDSVECVCASAGTSRGGTRLGGYQSSLPNNSPAHVRVCVCGGAAVCVCPRIPLVPLRVCVLLCLGGS